MKLGTPARKFMVALDTGSDLFWVPCDCEKCASLGDPFRTSVCPTSPYLFYSYFSQFFCIRIATVLFYLP